MRGGELASSLGSDETARLVADGATLDDADLFEIVRPCLDEE